MKRPSINPRLWSFAIVLFCPSLLVSCKIFETSTDGEEESDVKFASGVHVLLGDKGFADACSDTPVDCKGMTKIRRGDESRAFTYGELVALGGDFYASPDILFDEKNPKNMVERLFNTDTTALTKVYFRKELEAIHNIMDGQTEEYPNFDAQYAYNAIRYLQLAEKNATHFGWRNMKTYIKFHLEAIEIARQGYKETDKKAKNANLRKALYFNAFSDHFLTDGFAAGHIRVARQEIADWCKQEGYNSVVCGSLTKMFHDRDGSLKEGGNGLPVKNARGDLWETRTDGELFIGQVTQDRGVAIVTEAVRASVGEIFSAFESDKVPSGIFEATRYVPFPSPTAPTFTEKFGKLKESEAAELAQSSAWYTRLPELEVIEADKVKKLSRAFSDILKNFRDAVAADLKKDPNLKRRLPAEYIQGFLTMH